jgi:hypothetical protein
MWSPVRVSTTAFAYQWEWCFFMFAMAVILLMDGRAARFVVLFMGRAVAVTMFGCQVMMPGKAWVAMVLDVCIAGVVLLVWRELHRCLLWECVAVADRFRMLLCAGRMFVVCALRLTVNVRCRHWPTLVVAWLYV